MKKILGPNWKTSVGGVVAAGGYALTQAPSPTLHVIGIALCTIGLVVFGVSAKDFNVTGTNKQ